jgi:hypothetical protein
MTYETIDTDEIIKLFRQFMDPSSTAQVLYIVGETKLGKSHLLTKVFPNLAKQECQARYAVIDLRSPTHTIANILSLTSSQLDGKCFTNYQEAYKSWLNKPKVEMQHVLFILSVLKVSAKQEYDDLHKGDHHLTTEFIKDLETCNDRLLLLLVDHIDSATEAVKTWLINTFLVQISLLKHIRVVVAGRSVPEPHGAYAASCLHSQLHPVTEEDAYIAYCRCLNVTLVEQSVRDMAKVFRYRPGMFVDYVLPTFGRPR